MEMNKNPLINDVVYAELVKAVEASYKGVMDDVTAGKMLATVKIAQMAAPGATTVRRPAVPMSNPNVADDEVVHERLEMLRETMTQFLQENNLGGDRNALGIVEKVLNDIKPSLQQSLVGQESTWQRMQQVPSMHKQTPNSPQTQRSLTNPVNPELTPEHQHDMLKEPSIRAGAEGVIKVAMDLADAADAAGMHDKADAIASVLPTLALVRTVLAERIENYWFANGRAFEKAYREKIKSNKTPTDAWFAVLDEYQESLLTDQHDFVNKYAGYAAADKKPAKVLMARISDRLEAGSAPGVAFYEAMDEFVTGRYAAEALARVKKIAVDLKSSESEEVRKSAADAETKIAGFWDSMKSMLGFGGGMGSSWSDPGGSWMDKTLMPYANGGPVVAEFQKIRHQWENTVRPWLTGVAPHQAQVTRMEYNKYMKSMLSSLDKAVSMAQKAGFNIQVPQPPAVEMAGRQVIVNKNDLARFTQELFEDLRPFMDDQLALAIQNKTQQRDPKAEKAERTKEWWRNKQKGQPSATPAQPAAAPDAWNPAGNSPSWAKAQPSPRLAPHEISALEGALAKNNLPPDIKSKLVQFMGAGQRAASANGKKTVAQLNPQGPTIQPPANSDLTGLELNSGAVDHDKIKSALQEFFNTEYPQMGFMSSHFIDKIMKDVEASSPKQQPAPAPAAQPAPAAPTAPAAASPQADNATPLTHGPSGADFQELAKVKPETTITSPAAAQNLAPAAPAPAPAPGPVLTPAQPAPPAGNAIPSIKTVRKSPVGVAPV
jgi:hypothetical protein